MLVRIKISLKGKYYLMECNTLPLKNKGINIKSIYQSSFLKKLNVTSLGKYSYFFISHGKCHKIAELLL